jgi:phage repressor protein C with HTH and peptisase S24 domain
MTTLGSRVKALRQFRNLTQAELAAAVRKRGGDLSQPQVSAIEKDEVERPGSLIELAAELETSEAYLIGKTDLPNAAPPATDPAASANATLAPDAPLPPYRTEMPKDVPVYGVAVGGPLDPQFDFELNGTIVDYVRRPPRFIGRTDLFAAYVHGSSMRPWREPGQLIYMEAAKPPRILDYVLVEMRPKASGARPVLIKRLLGVTSGKIRLRQYEPPKDFDVERDAVFRMYRVIELDEMFGV